MPTPLCGLSIRGMYGRIWRVRRRSRSGRSCNSRVSASAIARFRVTWRRRSMAGFSVVWTTVPPHGNRRITVIPAWARRAARPRLVPRPRPRPGLPAAEAVDVPGVAVVAVDIRLVVEGEDDNGSPNLDGGRCAGGGNRTDPRRRSTRPEDFRNSTGGGAGTG